MNTIKQKAKEFWGEKKGEKGFWITTILMLLFWAGVVLGTQFWFNAQLEKTNHYFDQRVQEVNQFHRDIIEGEIQTLRNEITEEITEFETAIQKAQETSENDEKEEENWEEVIEELEESIKEMNEWMKKIEGVIRD